LDPAAIASRCAWLPHAFLSDGTTGGAIALVRSQEEFAEAYAIGAYRAKTQKPYLMMERIGPEVAVNRPRRRVPGRKKRRVRDTMIVFMPRNGFLKPSLRSRSESVTS
jgi:hypothetical protein